MKLWSKLIVLLYAALPVGFVFTNWAMQSDSDHPSPWPTFKVTQTRDAEGKHAVPVLDLHAMKQSINRMPAVTLLRQTGNSLRLFGGQQLSWSIWGTGPEPVLFHSVELWVSEGLASDINRQRVDGAAATVVKYSRILREEGWTILVVPVPTKLSIYPDLVEWPNLEKDPLTRQPIVRDLGDEVYDRFLDHLHEAAIPFLDLRQVYRGYRERNPDAPLLYPAAETHWSGLGLKLAADATAEKVSDLSGIQRRTIEPRYLEIEQVADLAKGYDLLPAWTNRLDGVHQFKDRLVNGDVTRGFIYPSAPDSLMVVVGTSYSGQFTWFKGEPVGFAWVVGGQLIECEFHNGAEAGQGSFVPFASFLQKRHQKVKDFKARRNLKEFPKIIVWEFPIRDLASLVNQ